MKTHATLRAFAKINVDLRVLGKRPDGFHELRTVFQTISVSDRIRARYRPAHVTTVEIGGNVKIEDNLMARATHLLLDEFRMTGEFRFELEKRIPMGAGLGGGSTDAAAVLMGLPKLMGRTVALERLEQMAASLGSDVPFFLHGGTAAGFGRGEELYPLPDLPSFPGLLVAPDIHVATAEAYGALSTRLHPDDAPAKVAAFRRFTWTGDFAMACNDFEAPVFERHPELAAIRETLQSAGAVCARMTGSGSSLFGLFPDLDAVHAAQERLSGFRTIPFSFVSRRRYRAIWQRALVSPGE